MEKLTPRIPDDLDMVRTGQERPGQERPCQAPDLFDSAYARWALTLESFQLRPGQLFRHMELVDPHRAQQSKPVISWCPDTDFVAARHRLQQSLERGSFPRALSQLLGHKYSWGETITAPYLWDTRNDPELTAALLLEASLFSRLSHSRSEYPRHFWPPIALVGESREAIRKVIRNRLESFDGWPQMCTTALPIRNDDCCYNIEEVDGLWRFLAEEHARLYRQYRVLRIDFVAAGKSDRIATIEAG